MKDYTDLIIRLREAASYNGTLSQLLYQAADAIYELNVGKPRTHTRRPTLSIEFAIDVDPYLFPMYPERYLDDAIENITRKYLCTEDL